MTTTSKIMSSSIPIMGDQLQNSTDDNCFVENEFVHDQPQRQSYDICQFWEYCHELELDEHDTDKKVCINYFFNVRVVYTYI